MFSSLARILNVQDVIIDRTKETSISPTCRTIPSTIIDDKLVYTSIRCTWYTQCRPTHPIPVQCCASVAAHCWFNAGQSYSTLAQHWNRIGWLSRVCSDCQTGDFLSPERPLPGYHDPLARLWNVGPPSAKLGQPKPKPLRLLTTNIIVNIFFSEDFLNTNVLNLGTLT